MLVDRVLVIVQVDASPDAVKRELETLQAAEGAIQVALFGLNVPILDRVLRTVRSERYTIAAGVPASQTDMPRPAAVLRTVAKFSGAPDLVLLAGTWTRHEADEVWDLTQQLDTKVRLIKPSMSTLET